MVQYPSATIRERIQSVLREGPATARDLSHLVGISEGEVPGHLEHVARSLKTKGERLVIDPATCLECGFAFTRRTRYTRPGHCPQCRSTRTTLPEFRIEAR